MRVQPIGTADAAAPRRGASRGTASRLLRTGLRRTVGVLLGAVTAVVDLTYLVSAAAASFCCCSAMAGRPARSGSGRRCAERAPW